MKKSSLFIALGVACAGVVLAQHAPKVLPLPADPPRPRVDRITDADDLLPVKSRQSDPDDLLPVESRLDTPVEARQRRIPSAAKKVSTPPMLGNFTFDIAIGYLALVPGGNLMQSYYLLDSRTGTIGMDSGAIASLANAPAQSGDGSFDFQVFTVNGDSYQYVSSEEGRFAMPMHSQPGLKLLGEYADGAKFERAFKPTGRTRGIGLDIAGKPYLAREYTGTALRGGAMTVWLADPDFDLNAHAASFMGVGVIPLPSAGVHKLVVRTEGEGAVFELSYVSRKRQSFSGASYQDIGRMMGPQGQSMMDALYQRGQR